MHSLHRRHRYARVHLLGGEDFRRHHLRKHLVVGGALVAVGLAWLLQAWGVIGAEGLWLAAPAVLAWSGLVRIALDRSALSVVRALVRFALAAYLVVVIEDIGGLTWSATWPVLAIGAGIAIVADALFARARADDDQSRGEEATW
jgi:hypothetical protein